MAGRQARPSNIAATTFSGDPYAYVCTHLRARDYVELSEQGRSASDAIIAFEQPCVVKEWFQAKDGTPVAVVAFRELTPRTLQVALLATFRWPEVVRGFYAWGVRVCRPKLLAMGYTRAECRVMEGHDDAVRMLEHLGFQAEARLALYGSTGKAFIQYAWRIGNHHDL